MTCFTFVVLRESVRAAEDELDFREFQHLTRMYPNELISDPSHKIRFHELLEFFQYAVNWDDPRITRHVTRMYARKAYVKSATRIFTEALISELAADPNSPPYVIRS